MDKKKKKAKKEKKPRKPYQKPEISTEKVSENLVLLACGKCETGPVWSFLCARFGAS